VSFLQGSSGRFRGNIIHSTEAIGITVKAGTPSIVENTISKHAQYGIYIEAGAEPQVVDNEFSENQVMDVFRA
jgi:parallel beta-helix repeat protein